MRSEVFSRFVILRHAAPDGVHWDLMLEQDGRLATWRLPSEPHGAAARPIVCVRIGDHRRDFLDYEGPISGGRGSVTRADGGTFLMLSRGEDEWLVEIHGGKMNGAFQLRRSGVGDRWTLTQR